MQEILEMCGNRSILFDNKTKDEAKKLKQLKQLLGLVDKVVEKNGGRPYTDDLFVELKVSALAVLAWFFGDDTTDVYISSSTERRAQAA